MLNSLATESGDDGASSLIELPAEVCRIEYGGTLSADRLGERDGLVGPRERLREREAASSWARPLTASAATLPCVIFTPARSRVMSAAISASSIALIFLAAEIDGGEPLVATRSLSRRC